MTTVPFIGRSTSPGNFEQTATDATAGERKTVTRCSPISKISKELMENLDPEETRAVADPALKLMIRLLDQPLTNRLTIAPRHRPSCSFAGSDRAAHG
jgi:hypothetical protein